MNTNEKFQKEHWQSPCQVFNAILANSYRIENHTARKWLTPLSCFGLTHASEKAQGFDKKYRIVGIVVGWQPQPITSGLLQAGCASRDKCVENQTLARVENLLETPPAASRHPVVCHMRTASAVIGKMFFG
jgi:hypothetical protein